MGISTTMPPHPDRIALQWLLVTGLLACASLATELPLWVEAIFAIAVAWRFAIERFHVYRPGRLVRYALVALVSFAVYSEFGTILGRDPGLALLVSLLGLKLLELRSIRDAMFTLFLFYIVLVGAFLFGQTLAGALWAIGTVVVSLAALIRLQHAIPARVALRLSGELLLKAMPLLVILYVFFPRLGGTLWGVPTDAYSGLTGMSDEMRPGSIRSVTESSETALRVDFFGTIPPARELYWRGLVLWETDGKTWRRGTPSIPMQEIRPLGVAVQYRVTLEPSNKPWLYALDVPVTAPENARWRPAATLVRNEPVRERISYDLTSHTRYTTGPLNSVESAAALRLPAVSARVRRFAEELRAQHPEPVAIAQAVLEHFRRETFVYTLAPPLLGEDPVDEFLFETRRGFCEHYASAFATLMRAAGVPARVVIGYQGGEINPTGNYLIVRQMDAHAWVEVWLEDRGWVRVDPAAAIAPERVELGFDAIRRLEAQGLVPGAVGAEALARALELPWFEQAVRQARLYWDYTNLAWYRWVVDYRRERQENFLHALGFETIDWPRVLAILGGSCTLVLIGYVVWSRRPPPLDPVQRIYFRFCRKLARAGIVRAPHEGPIAFAERAGYRRPDLQPAIDAVTMSYLDLRYRRGASNEGLRALARAVATFRSNDPD